jgi:hypothetical protein
MIKGGAPGVKSFFDPLRSLDSRMTMQTSQQRTDPAAPGTETAPRQPQEVNNDKQDIQRSLWALPGFRSI